MSGRIASLAGLILLLTACASEPPAPPGASGGAQEDHGATGRVEGPRPLFISPAGEPFHGEPGSQPPVNAWFAAVDTNHDGKLDVAELTADYDRFFKRLDVNGDGVIDGFEAQAYERSVAPELLPDVGRLRAGEGQDENLFKRSGRVRSSRRGPEPRGGAGRRNSAPHGAGQYQLFPDFEPIIAADADLDGKVTLAEWRARARAVFSQLDTGGTGALRLADLPKTPQQAAIERRRAAEEKRRAREN